jgi:hypothetical protein
MTTSVLAAELSPLSYGLLARHAWQVSWLAGPDAATGQTETGRLGEPKNGRPVVRQRVALAFPAVIMKRRTIRRIGGVQPRLIMMPRQWLFRHPVPASPVPTIGSVDDQGPQYRMEDPDRSTVAGSAVMGTPGLGPFLRIPFSSLATTAAREPSVMKPDGYGNRHLESIDFRRCGNCRNSRALFCFRSAFAENIKLDVGLLP